MKGIDLTGHKFGKWTVVKLEKRPGDSAWYWICRCECGAESSIRGTALRGGKSSGCARCSSRNLTHGQSRMGQWTREYGIWSGMTQRCVNPNNESFHRYGGRGITVCERWMKFEAFFEDMGPSPSPFHSIHRIDNDKGYCKENCRWATQREQQANRSNSVLVTCGRKTLCAAEWARRLDIDYRVFHHLITRGWTLKTANKKTVVLVRRKDPLLS